MHPDTRQLAAYLDGAVRPDERARLRAHILTCAGCAARLERLRGDASRITRALSSGAVPDVRTQVRARLRRPAAGRRLAHGLALAGALAALLLFASMLGAGSRGTAGHLPDRLFVTDRRGGQIVVLDARNGARLGATALGEEPSSIRYDGARDRLYVMLTQSIVAVDPRTLAVVDRWSAPRRFGATMGLALDERRARLYVAQLDGIVALALDTPRLTALDSPGFRIGAALSALAPAPDGRTIFGLDPEAGRLWTIAADGTAQSAVATALALPDPLRFGWLAVSRDGQFVYVLLTRARDGRPTLWRLDRRGQADAPTRLEDGPLPWDMDLLDTGQLAIPRGDGQKGGIELIDGATLTTTAQLDPTRDQHHVAAGPGRALFGLNFTHNTVTRFDAGTGALAWRTPEDPRWQPWDAVYVSGEWRWPW